MKDDNEKRLVGVFGDLIFFYIGINGFLDVVYNRGNFILVILDNRIIGMIGY